MQGTQVLIHLREHVRGGLHVAVVRFEKHIFQWHRRCSCAVVYARRPGIKVEGRRQSVLESDGVRLFRPVGVELFQFVAAG